MTTATKRHHDTSLIRLRQARSQAYWLLDHKYQRNASNAVDAINDDWSMQVDAIIDEERDGNEEKIRKLLLLITRIRRA